MYVRGRVREEMCVRDECGYVFSRHLGLDLVFMR